LPSVPCLTIIGTEGALLLELYGKPAVPKLVQLLGNSDPIVRQRATEALGSIGPEASEAAPLLVALMDDPNDRVRMEAAYAIGSIGSAAPEAVRVLGAALTDPYEWTRTAAAHSLTNLGPEAKGALPALKKASRNFGDWSVALGAAEAIGAIEGKEAQKKAEAYLYRMNARQENVGSEQNQAAAEALKKIEAEQEKKK
jgi:HEAT repeat protein